MKYGWCSGYRDKATGWISEEYQFDFRQRKEIYVLFELSTSALKTVLFPIQWIPGVRKAAVA